MLQEVADDLHLSNPHISSATFLEILKKSRLWTFDWGVIFAIGNDMHIHVMTNYRRKVFLRKPLRKVADEVFKEYEYITTSILKNKPEALKFDLRMGWKLVEETPECWKLRMHRKDFVYGKS